MTLDTKFARSGGTANMSDLMWWVLFQAPGPGRPQPMTNELFLTKEALERRGLVYICLDDAGNFRWRTTASGRVARVAKAKELGLKKYSDLPPPKG